MLTKGLDLPTMGIELREGIANKLSSPFQQQETGKALPRFILPACYAQQKPVFKNTHFTKFKVETLLYIFYYFPKDQLQAKASEELH